MCAGASVESVQDDTTLWEGNQQSRLCLLLVLEGLLLNPPITPGRSEMGQDVACIMQNDIPVFCPSLTDGSIGDMIYFHSYQNEGLVVDIVQGT